MRRRRVLAGLPAPPSNACGCPLTDDQCKRKCRNIIQIVDRRMRNVHRRLSLRFGHIAGMGSNPCGCRRGRAGRRCRKRCNSVIHRVIPTHVRRLHMRRLREAEHRRRHCRWLRRKHRRCATNACRFRTKRRIGDRCVSRRVRRRRCLKYRLRLRACRNRRCRRRYKSLQRRRCNRRRRGRFAARWSKDRTCRRLQRSWLKCEGNVKCRHRVNYYMRLHKSCRPKKRAPRRVIKIRGPPKIEYVSQPKHCKRHQIQFLKCGRNRSCRRKYRKILRIRKCRVPRTRCQKREDLVRIALRRHQKLAAKCGEVDESCVERSYKKIAFLRARIVKIRRKCNWKVRDVCVLFFQIIYLFFLASWKDCSLRQLEEMDEETETSPSYSPSPGGTVW